MSDAEDRLEKLRKLESLRRIEAAVAEAVARGEDPGLAAIQAEGQEIVRAREAELAAREPRRLALHEVRSGCSPEEAEKIEGAIPYTAGPAAGEPEPDDG